MNFWSHFSSPDQLPLKRDDDRISTLENQHYFKCKCLLCSYEYWSILALGINCQMDPLYKDAVMPFFMTMKELRELSSDEIDKHEVAAIEFIEKFNNIHPVNDTVAMQRILVCVWTLLARRFNFPPRDLDNSDYITTIDGKPVANLPDHFNRLDCNVM